MRQNWIIHNSHDIFYREPFGAVPGNQVITLRLKILTYEAVDFVLLRYQKEGNAEEAILMEMEEVRGEEKIYQAKVKVPGEPGLVWYYFVVLKLGQRFYYGNNKKNYGGVGEIYHDIPPGFQITVHWKDATTPEWLKDSVIYQIFVDRFFNGCPNGQVLNPRPKSLIHSQWDDQPVYLFERNSGQIARWSFFGGNLLGVIKKLPYLKSLGVNIIYFNPIFEASSNHKYDTADYHKIDPMFGDNQLFKELCVTAQEMGIAIILDGVFSHTGSDSIYFNKYETYDSVGAFQSPSSPYYKWYIFKNYPHHYDCWWGVDSLPNVNELEPSYQKFVISDENSVLRHWLKAGIAGWRLDVVDELPAEFIKSFRRTLKEENSEAVLIGEVWEDASNKISYNRRREYLLGNELDSVMNYPFRDVLLDFITGTRDAEQSRQALMSLYENYPLQYFYSTMNLIGSHDVPRVLTILKKTLPREWSKERLEELSLSRLKLLVLWQMTFPGVPSVYYGDEVQMEGGDDPYNRGTYPWGRENQTLLNWFRKLITLRNHFDVFRTGQWIPLVAQGDVFGYLRRIEDGTDVFGQHRKTNLALVLLNRSIEQENSLTFNLKLWSQTSELYDILQSYQQVPLVDGLLHLTLRPLEGKIFLADRWGSNLKEERDCGILLHPTSLPGAYGIGDLGQEALRFVDFLADSRQKLWQVLPLHPPGYGDSPYQTLSAFAGNPLLINPENLVDEGWLTVAEIKETPVLDHAKVDFDQVGQVKEKLFRQAFARFKADPQSEDYQLFVQQNREWLDDFALYMALKNYFDGQPWNCWDKALAWREEEALRHYRQLLEEEIAYHQFLQYIFFRQWQKLKDYANNLGIKIIGDIPIFVAHDSSDVWLHPEFFDLNAAGNPAHVAGVPPDYFSSTGQRWGNPLYRWEEMARDDYHWWRARFSTLLKLVDIIRVDHFRGFEDYWEIPAQEQTAVYGRWVKGPGAQFFEAIRKHMGDLPLIAEDLGVITQEVIELKQKFDFPGMRIMQFELDYDDNFNLPLSEKRCVVYTGSHDNDTILGWYRKERPQLAEENEVICWRLIKTAYQSDADIVIIPLQDILCLGSEARMNTPATTQGNWQWRFHSGDLTPKTVTRLQALAEKYRR